MTRKLETLESARMTAVRGAGPGLVAFEETLNAAGDWGLKHGGRPLGFVSTMAAAFPSIAYGLGVGAYHMVKGR